MWNLKNKYNKTSRLTDAKNKSVIISEKWIGGKITGRELKDIDIEG